MELNLHQYQEIWSFLHGLQLNAIVQWVVIVGLWLKADKAESALHEHQLAHHDEWERRRQEGA